MVEEQWRKEVKGGEKDRGKVNGVDQGVVSVVKWRSGLLFLEAKLMQSSSLTDDSVDDIRTARRCGEIEGSK